MHHSWLISTIWSLAATTATAATSKPDYHSNAGVLKHVNPKIGTYGITPNGNGGMIPSVAPPFAMTRWTPQTRENFISQCPYNEMDELIHGFQGTHQPAIWMGESGQVVLSPGVGDVKPLFEQRGRKFMKANEKSTPYVYQVKMEAASMNGGANLTESLYSPVPGGAQPVPDSVKEGANGRVRRNVEECVEGEGGPHQQHMFPEHHDHHWGNGHRWGGGHGWSGWGEHEQKGMIDVAMTGTSHVGLLMLDFETSQQRHRGRHFSGEEQQPFVFIQATRQNWTGHVDIDCEAREISGSNNQRQDYKLGPLKAEGFSGYFVSRFSHPFASYGVTHGADIKTGMKSGKGEHLGAYVKFDESAKKVEVRTAVSFVSVEQARRNLDIEAPETVTFDQTVENLKGAWMDKIGRVTIEGVNQTDSDHDPRAIWYTGLFHALQYPSDFSEPLGNGKKTFYSGYTDSVHTSNDSYYQSWSIWDTYRAEHSLLTIFAPERIDSMMRSLLRIFDWSGRLPMWANMVETNIMIGTHVDAVIANALTRGFKGFDFAKAWAGVKKNAFVPPLNDTDLLFYDREGQTPDEVRAGLTAYMPKGYVPNDIWAESASRTLDYAFDDFAASVVADHAGDTENAEHLRKRSMNYHTIFNNATGFMEAMNDNGTWAGSDQGWTEGDDWVYTFNVMHDPAGLVDMFGSAERLKMKLDEHFEGGHNDHSNEPSHHVPYMYAAIGYPAWTQNLTRAIANENYNATAAGLSGNEDLGQMSAWYVFSALGFYPVNSASDEYVVGAPFFEKTTLRLPAGAATGGVGGKEHELVITAPGAPTKAFVKSLKVDGKAIDKPLLTHMQIVTACTIEFEMADTPQTWGGLDA